MKLVFWQNMLSHLQSAHVRSLAADPANCVVIIGLAALSPGRKSLGWALPDFGRARVVQEPDLAAIRHIIDSSGSDAIHLLAGWRGLRLGKEVLGSLKNAHARIGLLTEGADPRGLAGLLRRLVYRGDHTFGTATFDFIIAMGSQGTQWFRSCGFPAHALFPYAYLVEKPRALTEPATGAPVFEITFLGQLIPRKAVDLAIRSLSHLLDSDWTLRIIGTGPEIASLRKLAASCKISERVNFQGVLANSAAVSAIASSDLLLLPSRYDGWGAVVNEALMVGTPVVCSDRCGAKDLIQSPMLGDVFRSGSVASLTSVLRRRIQIGRKQPSTAESIRRWSKCIEGNRGARFITDAVNHIYSGGPRPEPVWLDAARSLAVNVPARIES